MLPNIAAFIALVEKLVETAAEATSLLSVAVPPSQISPLVTSVEKVVADLEAAVATHKAAAAPAVAAQA
jgi:hypothetical protein